MRLLTLFLVLYIYFQNVNSYRILGILPAPSKSHYYIAHSLFKGLGNDGHDVTLISAHNVEKPIPNYNEVNLENTAAGFRRQYAEDNFGGNGYGEYRKLVESTSNTPISVNELHDILNEAYEIRKHYQHYFDLILTVTDIEETYKFLYNEISSIEKESQWIPAAWL